MAFMQQQHYHGSYYIVETSDGIQFVPADVVNLPCKAGTVYCGPGRHFDRLCKLLVDYVERQSSSIQSIELVENGTLCRLSAPGYLDCTDWTIHDGDDCEHCQEDNDDIGGDDN